MTLAAISRRSLLTLLVLAALLVWFAYAGFSSLPSVQDQRNQHLIDAVRSRDASAAARLIAQGANPNIRDNYRRPSLTSGVSLLAIAATQDDLPTLTVLTAHGADVNALSDAVDWNGPQYAVRGESMLNDWRPTPLIEAIRHDNLAAARLLLDRGASVNGVNQGGATPLMMAARYSRPAVAQFLLQRGANVNAASPQGWTALMTAASVGRADMVRLLISARANVSAQDRHGDTPLSEAREWKQAETAALLKAHGAKLAPPPTPVAPPLPPPPPVVHLPKVPTGPLPALPDREGGAAFARPVPGMQGGKAGSLMPVAQEAWLWASPTTLLFGQYPYRILRLDINTGRETFLPGLSAVMQREQFDSSAPTAVSPDQKWLLGKGQQGWLAVSLDGSETRRWAVSSTEHAIQAGWLPDGHRWVEDYYGTNTISARIHSLDTPAVEESPILETLPSFVNNLPLSVYPTVMNIGIADSMHPGPPIPGVSRFEIMPYHHGWTIRCSELPITLPHAGEALDGCIQAPHDSRLAWVTRSPQAIRFYVSRSDGRQMRLIFQTSPSWPITTRTPQWTPDGKRLIFWCGDVLYTVPVPA